MDVVEILKHPFFWGFMLGMVFTGLSLWSHLKTSAELKRYKRHLSDKLEIEAQQHSVIKAEKEKLMQENENLRIKIGSGKDSPSRELQRELEIFARAQNAMVINAPGFAAAWETAKKVALEEIEQEERGKSLPRRLFQKFVKSGVSEHQALPENAMAAEDSGESDDDSNSEAGKSESAAPKAQAQDKRDTAKAT